MLKFINSHKCKIVVLCVVVLMMLSFHYIINKDKIDINTATKEELIVIYGIGEVRAELIIQNRNEPYKDLQDLSSRTKIPMSLLENIETQIEFK